VPLGRTRRKRIRFSLRSGDPYTPSFDDPSSGGDGGTFRSAALRDREPTMGVLQDPAMAIQTLARLWPDSV